MSVEIIKDIARQVGVSRRTVQRVLVGELRDTRPTIVRRAARIRQLAADMDYRPNLAARATASGTFGCVSLFRPTGGAGHFSKGLAEGIETELAIHDMHLIVQRLSDERTRLEDYLPKVLRTVMADGLLINYTDDISQTMRDVIERDEIPTVWINCKMLRDCVYPDDVTAGRLATEHLIARGHRRIAYMIIMGKAGKTTLHHSEVDRESGYRQAMEAAGLPTQCHRIDQGRGAFDGAGAYRDGRFENACAWLKQNRQVDAIVTYSSTSGQPLLAAALALGIRVPQDLAITTIDDSPVSDLGTPITTVCLDGAEMGRQAVQMLLAKIKDPQHSLSPRVIPCGLVTGQTT